MCSRRTARPFRTPCVKFRYCRNRRTHVVRRLLVEYLIDRCIAQINHLVAIAEGTDDAKKQLNSPATLGRHDAATLLAHQTRCTGRRLARRPSTFEYHFVAVRLKMRGAVGGGPCVRRRHGRVPKYQAAPRQVPRDAKSVQRSSIRRRTGNLAAMSCATSISGRMNNTFGDFRTTQPAGIGRSIC